MGDHKKEVNSDDTSIMLHDWIVQGCKDNLQDLPDNIKLYWKVWAELRVPDSVPMLGENNQPQEVAFQSPDHITLSLSRNKRNEAESV